MEWLRNCYSEMKRSCCLSCDQDDTCDDVSAIKEDEHSQPKNRRRQRQSDGEEILLEPFLVARCSDDAKKTQYDRRTHDTRDGKKESNSSSHLTEKDRASTTIQYGQNKHKHEENISTTNSQSRVDRNKDKYDTENVESVMKVDIIEGDEADIKGLNNEQKRSKLGQEHEIDEGKETDNEKLKRETENLKRTLHDEETKINYFQKEIETLKTKQDNLTDIGKSRRETKILKTKPNAESDIDESKEGHYTLRSKQSEIKTLKTEKDTEIASKELKRALQVKETEINSSKKDDETFKTEQVDRDINNDNLKCGTDKLTKSIHDRDTELKYLKGANETLQAKLVDTESKIETLIRSNEDKETELTDLKGANETLQAKLVDKESKIETLIRSNEDKETELTDLKGANATLKAKLVDKESKIETLIRSNEDKETELTNLKGANETLKAKLVDKKSKIETLIRSNEDKETELTDLKGANEMLQAKLVDKKSKIESLIRSNEDKETELTDLKGGNETLKARLVDIESQFNELKSEIETSRRINEDKETEINDLKGANETLKAKLVDREIDIGELKVQIYCRGKTELSNLATTHFSERLRSELDDCNINFVHCHTTTDVKPDLPTVCLCVTVSRLGTDVANEVQHITLNSNVVLVILHHKAAHSIPAASSRQVLIDEKYQSLGGMFDLVFEKKELHDCDMNKTSMTAITDYLKQLLQK